jgi:prepilin-type processing-associated H-X9-DG protein
MGFVKRPVRKVIFMEPPLSPAFANQASLATGYPEDDESYRSAYAASSKAHWHSRKQQHGNVLFADFHVEFVLFNKEQINSTVLGPGMAPWDPGSQNRRYY